MKQYIFRLLSAVLCLCIGLSLTACSVKDISPSSGSQNGTSSNTEPGENEEQTSDDGGYMPPPDDAENAPDENTPVADMAIPTPDRQQTILLWEKGKVPAYNEDYQRSGQDADDFIPFIESFPAAGKIKGAVLICPGGAFQFRSMQPEGYAVARRLSALGYQCFVVSYRLSPYSQEVAALDLARAVRYVRKNADAYGISEDKIAVVGFSAGGILCGELLLNNDGFLRPSALDKSYTDDDLDYISAKAQAIGHIYSFYGRLSVSNNDVDTLRRADLPPAFYAYGMRDPFYSQFNRNVEAVKAAGVPVESHVFENVGHGFGAGNRDCDWIPLFDAFLTYIFEKQS